MQAQTSVEVLNMNQPTQRYIRIKELVMLLGVSRSTIYDWLDEKSKRYDPTFPKKIKIGASAVRFSSIDIEKWLESKRR